MQNPAGLQQTILWMRRYLDMLKQPFFKIENNYYMIKGIEGNDYFRIAVHGKHEDELAKLEAFILNCVKE